MKIGIVGGGSWGVTLADILANNGKEVMIYDRKPEKVDVINQKHLNPHFLDYKVNEEVKASNSLKEVYQSAEAIVLAIPSGAIRTVLKEINQLNINEKKLFINVAKGIEPDTLYTIEEVFNSEIKPELVKGYVTLSGPSLAKDVMDKKITLVIAASKNIEDANTVQLLFSNQEYFRVYTSDDLKGVELGGSVKNAIALISGILDGLDLGENARAALICRGLEELKKILLAYGGKPETLFGLSGLGDLIVTSVSLKSRNFRAGLEVAKGRKIDDIIASSIEVIEGPRTLTSCYQIGQVKNLDLPIINTCYDVLYNNKDAKYAVSMLMKRDLKREI